MQGDIDLCVCKGGVWSILAIYPHDRQQEALAEAQALQRHGDYDAISVINDERRQVLFSFSRTGNLSLRYGEVHKGLKESAKKVRATTPAAKPKYYNAELAKALTEPPQKVEAAFPNGVLVAFGGFVMTFIIMFMMANNGYGIVSMTLAFITLGSITMSLAIWVYSVFDAMNPEKLRQRQQLERQKHLQQAKSKLRETFDTAREFSWNDIEKRMEGDSHFGLILLLLGMAKGFHNIQGVDLGDLNRLVAELMGRAGIKPQSIHSCAANLHEYLAYPRYLAMYERGKEIANQLTITPEATVPAVEIMQRWLHPGSVTGPDAATPAAPQAETTNATATDGPAPTAEADEPDPLALGSNFSVIAFTDVVSFTEQVRTKGEIWMVDVLRAHNEIVREAIKFFSGREIKHTGDGIMMSFPTVEAGLRAAVLIQKGIHLFNAKMPDRQFSVRMGMSAGEPIYLDGDLFGTPVNLAARVLPYADGRQIAVSQSLYELSQNMGQNMRYTFSEQAECTLKGFEETQSVYFLNWENQPTESLPDDSQSAQADPQAESTHTQPPHKVAEA